MHDIHGCIPEHELVNLMERLRGTVTFKEVDLHAVGEKNVHVALKQVFAQRDISAIPKYQETGTAHMCFCKDARLLSRQLQVK